MSPKLTKAQQAERQEELDQLRQWLPKGSTVYTVLRHVSRSGLTRHIGLVAFPPDWKPGERYPIHPNYAAALVLDWSVNKHGDGVVVNGAGMDMGFHLVYSLAHALYGDGYALRQEWL